MSDNDPRVFITGAGVVSPLGNNVEDTWRGLVDGKSGAAPITRFDASAFETRFACEVKGFTTEGVIDRKDAKRMDRFVQYAVVATHEALQSAGLGEHRPDPDRIGVVVGSGIGGMETFEEQHSILLQKGHRRVSPFFIPMMISDMAAGQVSITFGLKGPNFCTVSACASGAHAIGESLRLLRAGDADIMLAGGAEATITPMAVVRLRKNARPFTPNDAPPHS